MNELSENGRCAVRGRLQRNEQSICPAGQADCAINYTNSSGGGIAATLDASYYKGTGARNGKEREVICIGNGQANQGETPEKSGTLNCMHDQQAVIYPGVSITSPENGINPQPGSPSPSLTTDTRNYLVQKKRRYIVRRLTPTECARLQGFPDWWTDGADGSDSAKYKLWGNGIALPCAEDVIGRLAKELRRNECSE